MEVYLPGDVIPNSSVPPDVSIVGYGINKDGDTFSATQPGLLRVNNGKIWLSVQSKKYIAQVDDFVLGIVTSKQGDCWRVDIGSVTLAYVNFLSFEGATKRNRPSIKTGDLLFAKIKKASRNIEPELTCVDAASRAKGMGLLSGGFLFKVALHQCRRLLSSQCQLLPLLGKHYKFEITIGMNGRIWLNSDNSNEVVDLQNIIVRSEYILDDDIPQYVESEVRRARGIIDTKDESMES